MKITNTTSGKVEELTYVVNGCCALDLSADSTITADEDGNLQASEESIAWWRKWIAGQEELDSLLDLVEEEFDEVSRDEIQEAVTAACGGAEVGEQPAAGKAAILDWMEENGYQLKTYDDGSQTFETAA